MSTKEKDVAESQVQHGIKILRERCGMSIRQLAEAAGVSAGMISCIERGTTSPSLSTLQKILSALGSDLHTFFGREQSTDDGPIIARENMKLVNDDERRYTIIFPKREGIKIEMLDEHLSPSQEKPGFESLKCDVAGYVLSGHLILEIEGEDKKIVRSGDAFYIPEGVVHRGYAADEDAVRLITVYSPGNY
jgi:transcriptional regulator with XRE-family HTH domain